MKEFYETAHRCWVCDAHLWHVDPALNGWHHYCWFCQHLTSTKDTLDRAMREKAPEAAGVVASVPMSRASFSLYLKALEKPRKL
jgi:hypothetical protein